MTIESADYCMLGVVKVTSLLAKAGSVGVLESELGQKWRYSALKACIG